MRLPPLFLGVIALLTACDPSATADKVSGDTAGTTGDCTGNACDEDGDGFRPSEGDCDDNNSTVNPGAAEICDGNDNNCDGDVDEGVLTTYYFDYDGDGFGDATVSVDACEAPEGYVTVGTDCDDANDDAFPGNPEHCDEVDNNCDGNVDEGVSTTYYADADSDGFGDAASGNPACSRPAGHVEDNTDCDDTTPQAYPGRTEVCDEVDNDCDGVVDEGVTTAYYADVDGDRYGDPAVVENACSLPTGYSENADDCDDSEADVNPAEAELCNLIDDDCDGDVDEDDAVDAHTWYYDGDVDGYGDPALSDFGCFPPAGYVADGGDCDDARALTNPSALEFCNTYDDDCDGETDEDTAADALVWYADRDSDGYGDATDDDYACYQPAGFVASSTDCDDADATSFPGGIEVCDGADNDCNGLVDDAPTDGTSYYADADGDELGDAGDSVSECAAPAGYVDNDYDCNDLDATEPVVADAVGGSSSGSGTMASPYASIQDAIDQANECVVALAGTYSESIDLSGKSLDVWGVEGSDVTTINPSLSTCTSSSPYSCATAVEISSGSGATPRLHGFTVTGGTGAVSASTTTETCADSSASTSGDNTCTVTTFDYCGGAIHVDGDDPVLEDLVLYNNELPAAAQVAAGDFTQYWLYSYGGGLCVVDGNVSAENVWVLSNSADSGGGVFVAQGAMLTFEQGVIAENTASDGGGLLASNASVTGTNAVIACNAASTDGGGIFSEDSSALTLDHLAFYGNSSSTSGSARGADVWVASSASITLNDSIVENSTSVPLLYGTGSATLTYNNVYNAAGSSYGGSWAAGAGSISTGSNFTSANCDGNGYNDDWTLLSTSSSVNAGEGSEVDADGTPNDMGAHGGPGGDW